MKQNKKTYYILILLLLLVMPLLFAIEEEPPNPDKGPPGVGLPLPIDGGLVALFVAGLFYGIKKRLNKK